MKKKYQQFQCSQIMLPEHREELQKQRLDKKNRLNQPSETDEQEKEHWDSLLQSSLRTGCPLRITCFSSATGGEPRQFTGVVEKILPLYGCIILQTDRGTVKIPTRRITLVQEAGR